MNKIDTEVYLFIEKYNFFISLKSIPGLKDLSTLDGIFLDWLYFTLDELDKSGYINLLQFDKDGIEYDYPRFIDNYSGHMYDLHGFTYLVEDAIENEH